MIGVEQLEDKLGEIVEKWAVLEGATQLAAGNIDVKAAKRVDGALVVCWSVGDVEVKHLTYSSRLACGNLGVLLAVPKGQGRGRLSSAVAGLDAIFAQDGDRVAAWGLEVNAAEGDLQALEDLIDDDDLDFGDILSMGEESHHITISQLEEVGDEDSAWMVRNVIVPANLYIDLE